MAVRLTAAGRQASLAGGLKQLFDGSGNNLNLVFKAGSAPADVDTVSAGSVIVTLAAADEGASNVNGSYAPASDNDTIATIAIRANLAANATAGHNYADGGDGAGILEVFVGTGRTSADKVADMTAGGPGTTGTQDFEWPSDTITASGLVTVTALNFTQG